MKLPGKGRMTKQIYRDLLRPSGRYSGMALILLLVAFDVSGVNEWREPGLYEIESQTVMPNLDEMRRIRKSTRRCIGADGPASFFRILQQPALRGCDFTFGSREAEVEIFTLECKTELVATGTARLWASGDRVRGALYVKMGGKNMTFSQYVDAFRVGPCGSSEPSLERR